MQSKWFRYGLIPVLALVLLAGAFSGGVMVGTALPWLKPGAQQVQLPEILLNQPTPASAAAPEEDLDTLFKPFWQTWNIVKEEYVDQPVDEKAMMRGAIQGMLEALGDQHTSYMDPDQYKQQNAPLQGEYEGIGAWVDITTEYVTIINPMPGSPAEEAGLKTGDLIVKVDGEDMTGIDGSLVLRQILGPAGTQVTLTIQREGETETFDVTIRREKIIVPSVTSKMLEDNIAYVELVTYGDKTTSELRKALREMMRQNPQGMILDLRNNGGGYLNTAIEVISQFIGEGVVMYEEYGDGTKRVFEAERGGLATQIPLVVLVNEGTASASEITAGAIQDYGRGKLVGATTYGKGSVQNWVELDDEQGAVRVTIARWLTPKERQIHGIGLTPDVVVELTEEDIKAERDPQLDKAVELLTGGQQTGAN